MKPTTRKIDVKQTMADLRRLVSDQATMLKRKDNQISEMNTLIGTLLEMAGKNK